MVASLLAYFESEVRLVQPQKSHHSLTDPLGTEFVCASWFSLSVRLALAKFLGGRVSGVVHIGGAAANLAYKGTSCSARDFEVFGSFIFRSSVMDSASYPLVL